MFRFAVGPSMWICLLLPLAAAAGTRAEAQSAPASLAQAEPPDPSEQAQTPRAELPRTAQRYELKARLDVDEKQVHGRARIVFTNTSARPLRELLLHLYMNAFRDDESVFMTESGGALRGIRAEGEGSIRLTSLRVGGQDALKTAEHELIAHDFTQLRVPLSAPLAQGGSLVIESDFVVALPALFARAGHARDFFAVAQWFPKLAKLEPDGHFESFPYHALGEFYADFADYRLEVDTPSDLSVAATGLMVEEKKLGARTVRHFQADYVHDAAFFAARGFRSEVEDVDGVRVRYLFPPGYDGAMPTHAQVVRAGLRSFGRAFGAYPYPALSVVVPPRDAPGAAGMEYPTLFVSEGSWLSLSSLPSLSGAIVTAHELAHQWFQGLLASDELHHPVLDEGLTEWASLDLMRSMFGPREGALGVTLDRFEVARLLSTRVAHATAPGRAAYAYAPNEYGASVYARAALALETIRRSLGRARFDHALSLYATGQRFKHPTPRDLERAFDAAYGAGFALRTLRPLLFDGAASGVHLGRTRSTRDDRGYVTEVHARRSGTVSLPTWLALYSPYGKELRRVRFPAQSESLVAAIETQERVARVVLDPDRALLVDDHVADQVAQLTEPGNATVLAQWLAATQWLSSLVGP
jgi:hypothetical protein